MLPMFAELELPQTGWGAVALGIAVGVAVAAAKIGGMALSLYFDWRKKRLEAASAERDDMIRVRDDWIQRQDARLKAIESEQDTLRKGLLEAQNNHKLAIEAHFQCEQRAKEQEAKCDARIKELETRLKEHIDG